MHRLRDLVVARNIRSVLFRLSPTTTAALLSDAQRASQALQTLRSHGFRLGFVGGAEWSDDKTSTSTVASAFDAVHFSHAPDKALYTRVSQALNVPLARTLLVTDTDAWSEDSSESHGMAYATLRKSGTGASLSERTGGFDAQPLSLLAQDLLSCEEPLESTARGFGPYPVRFSQIFHTSALSFALVNLKPIVAGHVLVVPKRCVDRFELLDADEVADLWCTAQLVGKHIERHFNATSLTFAIQDGAAAGQTVQHVHIHVLPRIEGDFATNDDVYAQIEAHERTLGMDDEGRAARSEEDMAREAAVLRCGLLGDPS